jgi:hypothetical protein
MYSPSFGTVEEAQTSAPPPFAERQIISGP